MHPNPVERRESAFHAGQLVIRDASPNDAPLIADTLMEAAKWVEQLDGTVMWVEGELEEDRIRAEVRAGMFVVAVPHAHVPPDDEAMAAADAVIGSIAELQVEHFPV